MKHKVVELDGPLLDAAVAKAEGMQSRLESTGRCAALFHDLEHGDGAPIWERFEPSTDWQHGGAIIERERRFCLQAPDALEGQTNRGKWGAVVLGTSSGWMTGPTALVAAMRAYVASKFGDEIDLP
jgi:hypothetical protein